VGEKVCPVTGGSRVGVVVPTYRRPERLAALLESLASVAELPLGRVIVVDDSPEPSVRNDRFPTLDLRVVRGDRREFMSEARNRGLGLLDEEFVLMIDDDNVVVRETFDHPLELLSTHPRVAAVMPSVLYRSRPDLVWVYACPFAPGRWTFDLVGRNRPRDRAWEDRLLPTDALPNAAFFRRDRLVAIGGYDPGLRVSSSADLCQRLKGAGGEVVADTFARTFHDVEPPGATAFWAAHGVDVDRTFHERRDWFVLQRRLHPAAPAFGLRALFHAAPFLASSGLAYALRADARAARLVVATAGGVVRGLRDAARDRGGVGYGPFG
jgi:glycosyltransferase involved in cell wall biosynthesis